MIAIVDKKMVDIFDNKIQYEFGKGKYSEIKRSRVKTGFFGGGFSTFDEPEEAGRVDWLRLINDHSNYATYDNHIK